MGFRSDVRINTTEKGFNDLNNIINDYLRRNDFGLGNNLLGSLDVNMHKSRDQRYFGWNNIIWYSHLHYVYVDAILNGLKELEKLKIPYRFTRIGEDVSDNEEIIYDDCFLLDYIDVKKRFKD